MVKSQRRVLQSGITLGCTAQGQDWPSMSEALRSSLGIQEEKGKARRRVSSHRAEALLPGALHTMHGTRALRGWVESRASWMQEHRLRTQKSTTMMSMVAQKQNQEWYQRTGARVTH